MGSFGTKIDGDTADPATPAPYLLALIVGALQSFIGGGSGGSGGIVVNPQTVSQVPFDISASGTKVIPAGSKGWTFGCKTGTGTLTCGAHSYTFGVGWSDGDPNTTKTDISIVMDSASTASGRYGT